MFRLVWYNTNKESKHYAETDQKFEYIGNRDSIWMLWYVLSKQQNNKYVEVFHIQGYKCNPEIGMLDGMVGYNL